MKPFQTLSTAHDNFLRYSLHREKVLGEMQLFISNILSNLLNTAGITLFTMSNLAIDYIFSQGFQISFCLFEAKFLPRIYVKGKFSEEKSQSHIWNNLSPHLVSSLACTK